MFQILVAAREAAERRALCTCLEIRFRGRCTVLCAGSGTEAVALFEAHRPQVVILDMELTGLSGPETARRIRRSAERCALLFLTDREDFSHARQALALRALDCLPKPWSEEELVRTVEEALALLETFDAFFDARLLTGACRQAGEEDPASLRLGQIREEIEAFIRAHYDRELTIQTVARAMNYSDAYCCKLFKQCFQVNFSAYLNEYRIARARELLRSTRLNIREVSLACGYTDSNYFARVFKRVTGMTPSAYRVN